MRTPATKFILRASQSLLAVAAVLLVSSSRAEIAEPSDILYGSITLDNLPVTAARNDVFIQARRSLNGVPVASYRMGENPRIGDFYQLELPIESITPLLNPSASQNGETLVIVLLDATGVRGQINFKIEERGQAQRADFGAAALDADADALPDAWELTHFGNLDQENNSISINGVSAQNNYISGADPNLKTNYFQVSIVVIDNQTAVSLLARRAEGIGYEGLNRVYSLETTTNLNLTPWIEIPNFVNLLGNNQTIFFAPPNTFPSAFYRARVWLQQE